MMARRKTKRKKPTSPPVQNFKQKRSQDRIDTAERSRLETIIAEYEAKQGGQAHGNIKETAKQAQ